MNEPATIGRQHRVVVGLVAAQVVVAALFVFLLLSAYHQRTPHALPVAVAASPAVTQKLQRILDSAEPDGFDLRSYPSATQARSGVIDGDVDGALLVGPGKLNLLTAGAGGTGPAQALTSALGAAAAKTGQQLSVVDVVPALLGDSQAFSVFFVILGVLFPNLVAGTACSLILRRSPSTLVVGILVLVAALIGFATAAIADGAAGLGHYLAIAGIVALFSLAVSAPAAALTRIKPATAMLAFLVFVVFGIPVSGGPGAVASLGPGLLRVLDPALPLGVAVDALRSAVYFHGHHISGHLLVLATWSAAGVAVLVMIAPRWRLPAPSV